MFDILEADIVVFQEAKIQRKDLRDDMVLVPGWDNYWSLPKHKKGAHESNCCCGFTELLQVTLESSSTRGIRHAPPSEPKKA